MRRRYWARPIFGAKTDCSAILRRDGKCSRGAQRQATVIAQRELGQILLDPKYAGLKSDPKRGIALLEKAAGSGDAYAMELLGNVYLDGTTDIKPRGAEAEAWLKRAIQLGDVSAKTTLGVAYVEGKVVKRHTRTGMKYLHEAAAQGDDTARTELGNIYLYGIEGVSPKPEKAQTYLQQAVKDGHAGAEAALGRAYVNGVFGKRRVADGARLLLKSAQAGHPTARYILAEAFLKSQGLEGVNRDYAQAWLQTVVDGNTDVAVRTLTEMLRDSEAAATPKEHPDIDKSRQRSRK